MSTQISCGAEWVFGGIEIATMDRNTLIPDDELVFRASRSSGPGGQNVNKLNTRITLFFDIAGSASLSDEQKDRIFKTLSSRIDKQGVLRVVSQKFRTQEANRKAALERFGQLLEAALKPQTVRKKTHVPPAAKAKRLANKKHHSETKRRRCSRDWLTE
jgi:ribosome-associated protein